MKKRVLSMLLALAMVLSMLPGFALAEETGAASAEVFLSYQAGGRYVLPKQAVTVTSDLSDTYGYTDSITDAVSALDVLIRAHQLFFTAELGAYDEATFAEWMSLGALKSDENGYMTAVFEGSANFSFTVDGAMPADKTKTYPAGSGFPETYHGLSISQSAVASGEYVEFFHFQDNYSMDNYTWLEDESGRVDAVTAAMGETLTFAIKGYTIAYYGHAVAESFRDGSELDGEGFEVVTLDAETLEPASFTPEVLVDASGNLSVSFASPGRYILSVLGDEYTDIIAPWVEVTVTKPSVPCVITAPEGATVQLFSQQDKNHSITPVAAAYSSDNGDGTVEHGFPAGGTFYRVTMDGKITRTGYLQSAESDIEVTFGSSENPKSTDSDVNAVIAARLESSTMVNINEKNHLTMAVNDEFRLRGYRIWEIINSDTDNMIIEPDFHVTELVNDDVISIAPVQDQVNWFDITALKNGTAILEVTYDAIYTGTDLYGATDENRTSIVVITVGNSADIDFGDWDTEFDTVYYLSTESGGVFPFDASGQNVSAVEVANNTAAISWTAVTGDTDEYSIPVTAGNNIVRVTTTGGELDYMVVRAAPVTPVFTNVTAPGETVSTGDTFTLSFDGLYTPMPKFAGVYNPYLGTGVQLSYTLDGTTKSVSAQYDIVTNNAISFTAPSDAGVYTMGGSFMTKMFCFIVDVADFGGHRDLTDAGFKEPTSSSMAQQFSRASSIMPDVTLTIAAPDRVNVTFSLDPADAELELYRDGTAVSGISGAGTYALSPGAYTYTVSKAGMRVVSGSFNVSSSDEPKTITVELEEVPANSWDGHTLTEPTKDSDGVYQIGTGAELAWFAAHVNANGGENNAVLTADIGLNGIEWTPIGWFTGAVAGSNMAYSGTFDGAGYKVVGLSISENTNCSGLFGYCSGAEIKNLTVSGTIANNAMYTGGIAAKFTYGSITNCVNKVAITGGNTNGYYGGIVGYAQTVQMLSESFEISKCANLADITTADSAANSYAGGIAGNLEMAMFSGAAAITDCYNRGDITGAGCAGGIAARVAGSYKSMNPLEFTPASVINSYSTGAVAGGASKTGAITGATAVSAEFTNTYYLEGAFSTGIGIGSYTVESKTAAELKELAATLGSSYTDVPTSDWNDGYPMLLWQVEDSYRTLTVEKGTPAETKKLLSGSTVAVTAEAPSAGYVFAGWVSSGTGAQVAAFADRYAASTTVTMPDADVTVTATYRSTGGTTPPTTGFDGYVTMSFEDNGVRTGGSCDYPTALGEIIASRQVGFYSGETLAEVTLRLLTDEGYTSRYTGTAKNGGNFYLSTITGNGITDFGEFCAGSGSGWMVMLNRQFINESAAQFAVKNGDVVEWQLTCQWGKDIGSDAEIQSAKITGIEFGNKTGKLSPAFSTSVKEYTYTIPTADSSVSLQVLLENYWTTVTYKSGGKTYRAMESIPVSDGTVITVDTAFYPHVTEPVADTDSIKITIKKTSDSSALAPDDDEKDADKDKDDTKGEESTATEIIAAMTDVAEGDWFFDAVFYAIENGLMNGVSDTSFAPLSTMTRAMLVTVLYRLEGEPAATAKNGFSDVADGKWYSNAVIWASENGVVNGISAGTFGVDGDVTREQIATILYRYAKLKGYDVTVTADLDAFDDAGTVSSWASEAMKWAVGSGIINGTGDAVLDPSGAATRAQVATMLMRFCELIG